MLKRLNLGDWKKIENRIAFLLEGGNSVDITIKLEYSIPSPTTKTARWLYSGINTDVPSKISLGEDAGFERQTPIDFINYNK